MKVLVALFFVCFASVSAAASSWGFEDASLSVHDKKAGAGSGLKEKYFTPKTTSIISADKLQTLGDHTAA